MAKQLLTCDKHPNELPSTHWEDKFHLIILKNVVVWNNQSIKVLKYLQNMLNTLIVILY